MQIPPNIQSFWKRFEANAGTTMHERFYEAFHFDNNEVGAASLAELVLEGRKRATASLDWIFDATGRARPRSGHLSVVTDWRGNPLCVIQTLEVSVVQFAEVGLDFAAEEGEGDGSLKHWRDCHWLYFSAECKRIGRVPDLAMPVLCERFELSYRE
ncbi:ASCH domain-containing protein [Pseudorhodoferax soli]|uniref:Uncharacterized protein YhfF n=1 Tax=Pseudorhodoferax soli TaxID=545864 RepID=A0A368X8V3_9BURK|nr:ASCH domain-containing protein [Pseudorhodoferax soli]RCW63636.1 uncharacterized protein YhfF [Pseudorhodoferax soli]